MTDLLSELRDRGFVSLVSDEEGLRRALERPITLYCGYDPSSASLTVGNLMSIMLLAHFQRHGHRPIVLMGGGTGMVGDPSGKTTQRQLLSVDDLQRNLESQRGQFARYVDFDSGRALQLNNADWLLRLGYVEFLRDIGRHFTVNQLLQHDTYRQRFESDSLSFIEFNYVLLQAFDFLHLFRTYDTILQVGGQDQWFNILAGSDLIRREAGGSAFALVTPLLTTSTGQKMGKSEQGAIWLDPGRTSPFAYYQFWINTDDADVERFLALYTFLPMDEVRRLGSLQGADLRTAKEVLAFEATALTHGAEAASAAQASARALFGGDGAADAVPATELDSSRLGEGFTIVDALVTAGLVSSKGEARRLVAQGGASLNGNRVERADLRLTEGDFRPEGALLRVGKKNFHRLTLRG